MAEGARAPSLAVPIDADNISARYAQALFERVQRACRVNLTI